MYVGLYSRFDQKRGLILDLKFPPIDTKFAKTLNLDTLLDC